MFFFTLTCVIVGDPLHNVDNRLIIVDTEAAVALDSDATIVFAFVVDFPGVFCELPAVVGPAALESLVKSSSTNPEIKQRKIKKFI